MIRLEMDALLMEEWLLDKLNEYNAARRISMRDYPNTCGAGFDDGRCEAIKEVLSYIQGKEYRL